MATLTFDIDEKTHLEAKKIFLEHGLSDIEVMNIFFKQIVHNQFSLKKMLEDYNLRREQSYLNDPLTMQAIAEARAGETISYEQALKELEEEIKNEKN